MCAITRATVVYQQIDNSIIANQIHGFTIEYGKFILKYIIVSDSLPSNMAALYNGQGNLVVV